MIEFQNGQDFIDRDPQAPPDNRPSGDVVGEGRAYSDFNRTPAGEPDLKFDVRSIFDSRPVNAYDFNISGQFTYAGNDTPETFVVFTVPEGYVAIVRDWYHEFFPTPVIGSNRDILMTPQVARADVQNNIDVPIGSVAQKPFLELFFLADEFQEVGFRINSPLVIPTTEGTNLSVRLHGTFLLKRNIPYQFEVANPCGGCGGELRVAPSPLTAPPTTTRAKPVPVTQPIVQAPAAQVVPPKVTTCPPGHYYSEKWGCVPYQTAGVAKRTTSNVPKTIPNNRLNGYGPFRGRPIPPRRR